MILLDLPNELLNEIVKFDCNLNTYRSLQLTCQKLYTFIREFYPRDDIAEKHMKWMKARDDELYIAQSGNVYHGAYYDEYSEFYGEFTFITIKIYYFDEKLFELYSEYCGKKPVKNHSFNNIEPISNGYLRMYDDDMNEFLFAPHYYIVNKQKYYWKDIDLTNFENFTELLKKTVKLS